MITTNTETTTIATKPERRLITKREFCATYAVSPATLDRMVRHQSLPHLTVGSRVLFRVEDIEGFFAARVRRN